MKGDKSKKKQEETEVQGTVPEIPIYQSKENAPILEIEPAKLQDILEYFDAGSEFENISLECLPENTLQVVTSNNTNDIIAHYRGLPTETKIMHPGYFVLEVKRILQIISKKFKDSKRINLAWAPNEKLVMTDDRRNKVEIALKSITTISKNIPPINRRFAFNNRILQFNKKIQEADGRVVTAMDKDGHPITEDAKTKILVTQTELMRIASDIDIAGVDYVIVNLENNNSYSESGTWNPKADTSKTMGLQCEVSGPALNKALPKSFISILKKLSGDIDVQGTQEKTMISVSKWTGEGELTQEMHYHIMQNKRRE